MDEILKKLKELRELRWEEFEKLNSDEKLGRLEVIMLLKQINQSAPLAVNLRNFGSNFDSIIFELISKAQSTPDNYYRLMLAFPEYVKLWEEWQETENEADFFKRYGV